MAGVNFFETPTGQTDAAYDPQRMLAMRLMQAGGQSPQGQTVNGRYVAPGYGAYAGQLANSMAGAYKMNQVQDAARAQNLLNGGTGDAAANGFTKIGGWLSGLFGGA